METITSRRPGEQVRVPSLDLSCRQGSRAGLPYPVEGAASAQERGPRRCVAALALVPLPRQEPIANEGVEDAVGDPDPGLLQKLGRTIRAELAGQPELDAVDPVRGRGRDDAGERQSIV